jgi:hypothetical protein
VTFLTPFAGLIVVVVVVPLVGVLRIAARAARVRSVLGLTEPGPTGRLILAVSVLGVAGLLALAATQPVIAWSRTSEVRTDAEAFFVLDTSRSMLARPNLSKPTRLERAKEIGSTLRAAIPDVPAGIASLTDRMLPHLFPTANQELFAVTVDRAIGIERPPAFSRIGVASSLSGLSTAVTSGLFSPSARHRLLVVLTDGESRPYNEPALAGLFTQRPVVKPVFVHVWGREERVYTGATPERAYRPDPSSGPVLAGLAAASGGRIFEESEAEAAAQAVRELVGRGPRVSRRERRGGTALAPYLTLGALLPLSVLLVRRGV